MKFPTTDLFRIACARYIYKVFAYIILGRIDWRLEAAQPPEQHGFRAAHRIAEYFLTAAAAATGIPLWISSADLSKGFDKVRWDAVCGKGRLVGRRYFRSSGSSTFRNVL